jgi:hypothetical protein
MKKTTKNLRIADLSALIPTEDVKEYESKALMLS